MKHEHAVLSQANEEKWILIERWGANFGISDWHEIIKSALDGSVGHLFAFLM